MGYAVLLSYGVKAVRGQRSSLDAVIGVARADAALEALDLLPSVLEGLNALAWSEAASTRARAALTVVMAYGLKTQDLLPAQGDNVVLGVLDDAYLAFFAATELGQAMKGLAPQDLARHATALKAALPPDVVAQLEAQLTVALDEIEAFAKGA